MEIETPLKEGFLLFPPHGILMKKKWHKKYCKLFKSSKHGIERIEIFETEEDSWKNKSTLIVTLENCVKITPTPQKYQQNVFTVLTKSGAHEFATLFDQEMQEWITAFQTVAFKDDISGPSIEEDNDLYCSSGEGIFTVKLIPTPTSIRCGLADANYTLVITQNALQLRSPYPLDRLLFTWPFRYIRRYGYRDGHITFEAGRKCDSGEGLFQLENSQNQEIFRCISTSMKSWRKIVCKEEPDTPPPVPAANPPMIVCGDGQFQAALNMEPGSRTPLPPSPTSATNRFVEDFSTALESTHAKQKPSKPPRKGFKTLNSSDAIDPGLLAKLQSEYEEKPQDSSSYDKVEVIREAWKTLGVDHLTHTENVLSDEDEKPKITHIMDDTVHTSRKIIHQTGPEENYDKLQHFGGVQGPTNRTLALTSQYRQIIPLATTPNPSIPPSDLAWNEYDVIQEDLQETFRQADDSHLGYGVIRKHTPAPAKPQEDIDQEYSMVLKPKRA